MGKATIRQILYANAIADELGIDRPSPIFEDCKDFINKNVNDYKKNRHHIVENCIKNGMGDYGIFARDYDASEILWIEENLKGVAGIYVFVTNDNQIAYIGKSLNLADRIPSSYGERRRQVEIIKILYYPTETKADASILEMLLITENKPLLNKDGNTDDKSKLFKSNLNILNDFKVIPFRR